MNNKTVAFIGLGVMGYPMAKHLSTANFNVRVYNRTQEKAVQWLNEHKGTLCATPKDAATGADLIFICVGNDDDVRSVVFGKHGALAGAGIGAVIVDHTTTSADLATELELICRAADVGFIDAPVSGGQAGAENGILTAMCGGEPEIFDKVIPALESYCKNIQLIGHAGQGQRCKMINQICIAGILQGLSEAITLAKASDLPIEKVIESLKGGAAGSWQLANRAQTMADNEFNFGFAIDWMIKDLGICLKEADKHNLDLSLTKNTEHHYQKLSSEGLGRLDTSALYLSLQQ